MPQGSILKVSQPRIPTAAPAERQSLATTTTTAFAMLSHRGRVRHLNQDACDARPDLGAFVVCDGMGGAASGEVASHLTVHAFLNALSAPYPNDSADLNHPRARLAEAVADANHTVFAHSRKSPSLHGMGTTLVALLFADTPPDAIGPTRIGPHHATSRRGGRPVAQTLWLAHVGDSRCYRLRSGVLDLLTRDHSLVEEHIQAGLLTRVQAAASPIRNIITRAVGSDPLVEPEIATFDLLPGDLYLLASDGLTRELDDSEIARILTRTAVPRTQVALDSACHALIDAANRKGGHDNITTLLVAV